MLNIPINYFITKMRKIVGQINLALHMACAGLYLKVQPKFELKYFGLIPPLVELLQMKK